MTEVARKIVALLDACRGTGDVRLLMQAAQEIDEVEPMGELDFTKRQEARRNKLVLWLMLLDRIDQQTDPRFNREAPVSPSVFPPSNPGGVSYAGMPPNAISDPEARRRYQDALAANDARVVHYRHQTRLRKLDRWATPRAENYIRRCYLKSPKGRNALARAVAEYIGNLARQAKLNALLA